MNNKLIDLYDTVLPEWARRPLVTQIFAEAELLGGEARIVGGAVRDWLAGYSVGDIDMAINLPIETVASHFSGSNVRVVETGLQHGTITVCDEGDTIELTQTRIDLETDGRHAIVAHDRDWSLDAARRDFTINAIYLDAYGKIFDPLNGRADLQAGILRFAGDAVKRVTEDSLRILRYCRFLPRFEKTGANAETVILLRNNAALCADLSGERITRELRQIMVGDRVAEVIRIMRMAEIDRGALGVKFNLPPFVLESNFDEILRQLGWLVGLATVMPAGSAGALANRLRLSRSENRCLACLDAGISDYELALLQGPRWKEGAYYLGVWAPMLYAVQSCRNKVKVDTRRCAELVEWTPPKSPICGADLLSHGVDIGPGLGQMLVQAESRWVASNFTLNKKSLLEWLFGN